MDFTNKERKYGTWLEFILCNPYIIILVLSYSKKNIYISVCDVNLIRTFLFFFDRQAFRTFIFFFKKNLLSVLSDNLWVVTKVPSARTRNFISLPGEERRRLGMPRAPRRPSDEARRGAYKPRVDFGRSRRRRREDGLLALRRLDRDAGLFKRRRDETAHASASASASDPAPAAPGADPPAAGALPPPAVSPPPDAAAPRDAAEAEVCVCVPTA
jgi:hypothetical protein